MQVSKKERRGSFNLRGTSKDRRRAQTMAMESSPSIEESRKAALAKSRARKEAAANGESAMSPRSASDGMISAGGGGGDGGVSLWLSNTDLASSGTSELRTMGSDVLRELKQSSAPPAVLASLERLLGELHRRLDLHERGTPVSTSQSEPLTPSVDGHRPRAGSGGSVDSLDSAKVVARTAKLRGASESSADGDVDEPNERDTQRASNSGVGSVIVGCDGVARPPSPSTPVTDSEMRANSAPPPSTGRFNTGFLEPSFTIEEEDEVDDGVETSRGVTGGEETQEDREKRASGVLHSLGAHAQHFWADGFDSDDSETYLDDLDWEGQDDGGTEI